MLQHGAVAVVWGPLVLLYLGAAVARPVGLHAAATRVPVRYPVVRLGAEARGAGGCVEPRFLPRQGATGG